MMNEKLSDSIMLTAKAGLFFASCDGEFSQKEKEFIEGYISSIEEVGEIPSELKVALADTINHTYTLEEIIGDTLSLVEDFNDDERKVILFTLRQFILKAIASDSRVKEKEVAAYDQWLAAVGM
ncbi:MAG: hypothetical protein IKQ77_03410 [Prevotella sp.]|jgi:hypothetical protein|nr:hypothetical protein [Prevotella sp.]